MEKNALSRGVEESFEKFLEADDFQNLISSSLATDASGKIFVKIRSVVLTHFANRQTTPVLHNVLGGRKKYLKTYMIEKIIAF